MRRAPFLIFFVTSLLGPSVGSQPTDDPQEPSSLDKLLDTKVSSAAKYEQTAREAPASVTVITSEDIERFGYRTLDEVLRSVPGFYTSYDRNYAYVGVRGFSRPTDYNNRLLFLLDGQTLNENVFGSANLGTEFALDLAVVERIEIVRGPGSSLFGTGAMFAVVNVITKKGSVLQGGRAAAQVGSFGHRNGSASFGKEMSSGLDVLVSGTWSDTDGQDLYYPEYDAPDTNNGLAQGMDYDRAHGLFARVGYRRATLTAFLSSRTKGIPTGAYEVEFNHPASRTRDRQRFLQLSYNVGIGAGKKLLFRGYLSHNDYDGSYPYEVLNTDGSRGDWAGSEVQLRWDLSPNHRLAAGAEYRHHRRAEYFSDYPGQERIGGNFPFHVGSASVEDTYEPWEKLSLTVGLRHDEYSTVGSSTTPRAAVVFTPVPSGTLKLLYGEAFRAPDVYEVRYEDPVAGFIPNPDLKAERIRTFEVSWDQRLSPRLHGTASLYHSRVRNLIDPQIDPVDSQSQFRNVASVRAQGLELGLIAHVQNGVRGYARYALQTTEGAEAGTRLTNSPAQIVKLGATGSLRRRLHAAGELVYETSRRTVQDTSTKPFLLANTNLSIDPLFGRFGVSLRIRNLFDTAYSLPGGLEHRQGGIPQDGRSFALSVEARF